MDSSLIYISVISGMAFAFCVGVGDFLQSILARRIRRYKTLFLRFLFTIILLLPFIIYFQIKGLLYIKPINLVWLVSGTVLYMFGYISYLKAFEIGEVSVVSPISSAGAAITVILAAIFLNEHLGLTSYFAILLIIIGIGLTSTDIRKIRSLKSVKGLKEALTAMLLFGIYFFSIGLAGKSTDPLNLFIFAVLIQSIIFMIYNFSKSAKISRQDLGGNSFFLFLAIVFLYAVAWMGFNYGASKGIVSVVGPVSALYPVVTVLLATIFYKERLVLNQFLGIALTIIGLVLINFN